MPQQVIRRLALLVRRSERLGSALPSSPLLDDPIAGLTAASFGESALEAVLLRLEGRAAATTAAARAARPGGGIAARRARRRPSSIAPAFRAEAAELPVDVRHRPTSASRQTVRVPRVRNAVPTPESRARATRAAAATPGGSLTPGSPSMTSPLARAAARVTGGAEAIATPVSAEWTAAEPVAVDSASAEPVAGADSAAPLRAALARAGTQPIETAEPPQGRSRAPESADRLPRRFSLADALAPSAIAARPPAEAGDISVPAGRFELAEVSLTGGHGSSGLAELVRRWETTHGHDRDHDDPSRVRLGPDPEAVAGIEAESALARALERLLTTELRRSGIEVDVG